MRDCCCGEPDTPNVVHRTLEPCYVDPKKIPTTPDRERWSTRDMSTGQVGQEEVDPKYLLDKNLRWELKIPWWKRVYLRIFRRYTR